ncbi:hypothetical protein [Opitutus sp. ER46]|uniref:hypothetical protein n=1 Tax=Opitutus sp. ER46 TaxID=2161864 RepID=UPI000D2F8F97|nr:hypothetical protein [Opitutus sp. ER46]PTX94371.1 hypothetical protein DB354_11495 [Opitutus sp. ER46]
MKFISVIGSAEQDRAYDPPLRDASRARQTAAELGAMLAKRGYGLIVYAGNFIERDAVRGYVAAGAKPGSVRVQYSGTQAGAMGFPECAPHPEVFDPQVDNSPDWEMSFYSSLAEADGVVLIGGGNATYIAGVVALANRVPVLALRAFGGSAEKIWSLLANGRGLAAKAEVQDMGRDADPKRIEHWVDSLATQARRRHACATETAGRRWSMAAILLLLGWILALPLGYQLLRDEKGAGWFIYLLFVAPALAGASGATMRLLRPTDGVPQAKTIALGAAAGAISGVMYILSHLFTDASPSSFPVLAMAVAFGFIAGFTFDAVFQKLERQDALRTDALKPAGE